MTDTTPCRRFRSVPVRLESPVRRRYGSLAPGAAVHERSFERVSSTRTTTSTRAIERRETTKADVSTSDCNPTADDFSRILIPSAIRPTRTIETFSGMSVLSVRDFERAKAPPGVTAALRSGGAQSQRPDGKDIDLGRDDRPVPTRKLLVRCKDAVIEYFEWRFEQGRSGALQNHLPFLREGRRKTRRPGPPGRSKVTKLSAQAGNVATIPPTMLAIEGNNDRLGCRLRDP